MSASGLHQERCVDETGQLWRGLRACSLSNIQTTQVRGFQLAPALPPQLLRVLVCVGFPGWKTLEWKPRPLEIKSMFKKS